MSDDVTAILVARTSLLMQLLRQLFRERAYENGQTREDIMAIGEEIKQFLEARMYTPEASAHLTAEVDNFFNILAADVAKDQGNRPNPQNP